MLEKDFLGWVLDVAARFSWRAYHVPAPMRAVGGGKFVGAREAAGLCDLLLLHADPPRLILAEVKGDGGSLSAAQKEFLTLARDVAVAFRDSLRACGADEDFVRREAPLGVYTWRPGLEPLIEATLRSRVAVV